MVEDSVNAVYAHSHTAAPRMPLVRAAAAGGGMEIWKTAWCH